MRKDLRTNAATKVAAHLIPAETAIDEAVAKVASLIGTMLTARLEANLPMSTGQSAIDAMTAAMTMMISARSKVIESHGELARAKVEIGLRTVSFGDMGCPPIIAEIESNVVPIAA
jgi:hypothetical protein